MTILRYEGIVKTNSFDEDISIGGKDIIPELERWRDEFKGPVTVAFADERFTGDLYIFEGTSAYSEWTPGDPAEINVGDRNLLSHLEKYEGKQIILWIADEPINTLDPPPSWANVEA